MRSTPSCQWCRRSKVKCSQHDGDDPCQLCLRAGRRRDQCVLERLPSKARATRRQTPTVAASVAPLPHVTDSLATTGTTTTTTATGVLTETGLPTKSEYSSQSLLCSLDDDSVTEVVEIFSRKFPELSFVHIADFLQRLRTSQRQILLVKMAAILALCARFVPSALCHFESPRAASEHYAAFVQQRLWPHIIHEPDAEMVHCLLLIAQYEWGEGNSFAAWMYTGMAIRMMQGLQAATDTASTSTESVLESGPSRDAVCKREIQRRTVWACFTMDRTICCGRDRPTILRTSEMTLYLPAGEDDFDLGIPPSEPITYGQVMTQDPASCARLFTIADYYTVVIRSLDIWSHACRWVANGGRRQASALETCPWETGSEWHRIATTLEQWRSLWHFRLKYPQTPTSIYLHRRQGERFAFVNLIYYLSVIILYREYVPFVPALHSGLRGPIDAPLLVREAPVGWWTEYSKTLFDASAQISRLLTEMKAAKLCFMTPIVGYGAFSAASMNVYLAAFPWVDPASSESVDATQLSRHDLEYLHDFAEMWPLGKPWIQVAQQTLQMYCNVNSGKNSSDQQSNIIYLRNTIEQYGNLSVARPETGVRDLTRSHSTTRSVVSGVSPATPTSIPYTTTTSPDHVGYTLGADDGAPSTRFETPMHRRDNVSGSAPVAAPGRGDRLDVLDQIQNDSLAPSAIDWDIWGLQTFVGQQVGDFLEADVSQDWNSLV